MIFKYYDIKYLPSGLELNPVTLTTWLKEQPDGYIGNGLVNWLALSRLSKEAKPQNPSFTYDALEYRRINSADTTTLANDLANNQPGILEIPGHFVVVTGSENNTYTINDPYYDYTTLDNTKYNNTVLSLGRYIPSNTNLSYIMLVTNPDVNLAIANDSGEITSGITNYIQSGIVNPLTGVTSESKRILLFPTPADDVYTVTVITPQIQIQTFPLQIYEYTQDGSVLVTPFQGYTKADEPATYSLNYQQNPLSTQATPTDITSPQILRALTRDSNKNGKVDSIEVQFIRIIHGSSVNSSSSNSDFIIDRYSILTASRNTTNHDIVTVSVQENPIVDSGMTPQVTLKANGIKDGENSIWNHQQLITTTDGVPSLLPSALPISGVYSSPVSIDLTSSDSSNTPTIFYTLDGSNPSSSSSHLQYAQPFSITTTKTLKAVAIDNAGNESDILTQVYTVATMTQINSAPLTSSTSILSSSLNTSHPPTCNDQKPQTAPQLISATPGLNSVTLQWQESKGPLTYYLSCIWNYSRCLVIWKSKYCRFRNKGVYYKKSFW